MNSPANAAELESIVAFQRAELDSFRSTESDHELAYRLQLQEAMAASLSSLPPPPSSSAPPPPVVPIDDVTDDLSADITLADAVALQALELERFRQEREDAELHAAELRRAEAELRRRAHDHKFAREIDSIPDEEWEDYGDDFERPFDEQKYDDGEPFGLYFKGMASTDFVKGKWVQLVAIGIAVCDPSNTIVLKIQKPVMLETGEDGRSSNRVGREALEAKALIEGLNTVLSLGIKRINVFFDFKVLYNHVMGRWRVKQQKIANMINQVMLLKTKLESCEMFLLPRCHMQFVFKLARDAIDAQIEKNVNLGGSSGSKDICNICLEDTDSSQMFSVDGCMHRFCFSCMKQHVEVKLLHGMLPGCPQDGCRIMLQLESSKRFLSDKLYNIMFNRIRESSIPANEKVYCPYPKCSALMSRTEAIRPQLEPSSSKMHVANVSGLRKCIKCDGAFCISCQVPWHANMSCYDYRRLNPHPRVEDARLQSLARLQLWRQCIKCKHMIELAEGCFHITCRCGYEFCYTCGAEWKNKKATCSCPLWDEQRILYDYGEDENSDDDGGEYYDDTEDEYL